MGRGINPVMFGNYVSEGVQFRVTSCWIPGEGSSNNTSYIVRQTGESTFVVLNTATGVSGAVRLKNSVAAAGDAILNVHPIAAGTGATATAVMRAKSATVVAGGTGYSVGNTITVAGGTNTTPAVLTVSSVSGGAVTGVTVSTAGSYTVLTPATTLQASTSGSGTGATFKIVWEVLSYTIGAGGTGYVNAVANIGTAGGATATVTVSGGAVSAITPSDRGSFSVIPTVVLLGTGATETAKRFTMNRVITTAGNTYKWNANGSASVVGEARIPLH